MGHAVFRFYAELNDFIPAERRGRPFCVPLDGHPAVKDTIEALGVPHTEVDLILVNGEPVGFAQQLEDGDRISVYPVFESLDISPLVRLRPQPLRECKFVLDTHLGKLATYLRMLGFDTLYRNDFGDEELARISQAETRILLTRDRGLLKRSMVTHGYLVRSNKPRDQAVEVLQRFDLVGQVRPLSRCLRCNGLLDPIPKERVLGLLEEGTAKHYNDFWQCRGCGRLYWRGSHHEHMSELVRGMLAQATRMP